MTSESGDLKGRLSDADIAQVKALLKGVDSVELKATVPVSAHRATIAGLPLDPVEAEPRHVYFLDTPDLALDAAGIVVRARRIHGGRGDTVVKLRPVVPDDLPVKLRRSPDFKVELDALPGGFVCSASFKGKRTSKAIHDAVVGDLPLRKIFSKEQRAFFAQRAPADLGFDALVPLGPIFVLKANFTVDLSDGLGAPPRPMVAELWLYPDGSRILELSTKCRPREAFEVAAATRAYLVAHGVDLSAEQQTKTRAALDLFRADAAAR